MALRSIENLFRSDSANKNDFFEHLCERSRRIINAKKYLFTGVPYKSKLKPNKYKTYDMLNKIQNIDINKMGKIFN